MSWLVFMGPEMLLKVPVLGAVVLWLAAGPAEGAGPAEVELICCSACLVALVPFKNAMRCSAKRDLLSEHVAVPVSSPSQGPHQRAFGRSTMSPQLPLLAEYCCDLINCTSRVAPA